jgi:cytochrome b561
MAQLSGRVSRYHWTLVLLHWSVAGLVLLALALGALALVRIPNADPMKVEALRTHMTGGLAILALMLVRLLVRARSARPEAAATGHRWLDRLAWLSHRALYVTVIAMALAGLTMGIETGVVALLVGGHPPIPDDFWIYPIRSVHYAISRVLMGLIVLHVSGAAYHTFIRRDGLLGRMWFGRRAVFAGLPATAALRRPS